jgi:16S rRNA (uracil1498-N3)-methyltransferase
VYVGTVELSGADVIIAGLRSLATAERSGSVSIVIAAALIRPDRFDWLVQKATELGVEEIVPLETRFSAIRIAASSLESRMERWGRIAREASKQSCRVSIPRIHNPVPFPSLLERDPFAHHAKYFCYEKGTDRWNQGLLGSHEVLVCVGPEGGWDTAEVVAAERAGYRFFSLGKRILRAETAALAAITLFQLGITNGVVSL